MANAVSGIDLIKKTFPKLDFLKAVSFTMITKSEKVKIPPFEKRGERVKAYSSENLRNNI